MATRSKCYSDLRHRDLCFVTTHWRLVVADEECGEMRLSPLVILHICCGSVGLLSGTLAMVFRKGSQQHVLAGKVFVVSMLGLAASGAIVGYLRSQTMNMLMGSFTFYLVATGWSTGRQRDGKLSAFDWVRGHTGERRRLRLFLGFG